MYIGQYLRIEKKAGGLGCTDRQFIKAAHSVLTKAGRSRAKRTFRHDWLREGLRIKGRNI